MEAAFALPIFIFLMFGVIEFGLAMSNYLAVSNSVRAGSRTASAVGDEPKADLYTLLSVGRESAALDKGTLEYIVIYNPGSFGQGPEDAASGCENGIPQTGKCNVYRPLDLVKARVQVREETEAREEERDPDPDLIAFGDCINMPEAADCFWDPGERDVDRKGGTDFIGVYMKISHRWVTGMFGDTKTLDDQSVGRLEPRGVRPGEDST